MKTKFCANQRGGVAISFALALLPVLLSGGVAIDYSRANFLKAKLQAALDAAVLASAKGSGLSNEQRIVVGRELFASVFQAASSSPQPTFTIANGIISATATSSLSTSIMAIAGIENVAVTSTAAAAIARGNPCILLLEPGNEGLKINSNSQLRAKCGVHVNAAGTKAIDINGASTLVATDVCIKGNYQISSDSMSTPSPERNCPAKPDPLATLPEPTSGGCAFTDLVVQSGQSRTLTPGVYCGKLEIQNNASVTFSPGTYVFPNTDLIVNSGGRVSGSKITLFFNQNGRLNVNSGARVQITAPSSGTYKGILLFQSRATSSASSPPHIVNSDSASSFAGTIYVPQGTIMLNSDASLNLNAGYTAVIARKMELNSRGVFHANNDYFGEPPLPDGLSGLIPYPKLVR